MAQYIKQPFDFMERTKELIENYRGKYKASAIINSSIGLLFVATEKFQKEINRASKTITIEKWGLKPFKISLCVRVKKDGSFLEETMTLATVSRHIRNSLAHCHFTQIVKNSRISGFELTDYSYREPRRKTFEMEVSLDELKQFMISMANYIISDNSPHTTNSII